MLIAIWLRSSSSSSCREVPLAELRTRPPAMSSTQSERRWAYVVAGVIAFMFAVITFASVHWAAQPPSNVETIDASRLHLSGEFVESQPRHGDPAGRIGRGPRHRAAIYLRAAMHRGAHRYPGRVPRDESRVVHGFLITGTNINTMVVPGFVAEVRTRFEQPGDHPDAVP